MTFLQIHKLQILNVHGFALHREFTTLHKSEAHQIFSGPHEAFKHVDANDSGHIDFSEFTIAVGQELGLTPRQMQMVEPQTHTEFKKVADHNDKVDFEAFVSAVHEHKEHSVVCMADNKTYVVSFCLRDP